MNKFVTNFKARNVSRGNAVGRPKGFKNRKKRANKKQSRNKKRKNRTTTKQEAEVVVDDEIPTQHTDLMRKLYEAHPRHIIKLILKKLIEKPSFYRLLGSLGIALKASDISLSEYLLSSSNKLSKLMLNKLKYDIHDARMLILARLAIHKMLIREGTKLKSLIQSNGVYPIDIDSDNENEEIAFLPPSHQSLKKGLKYISNDQFVQQLQKEEPPGNVCLFVWHCDLVYILAQMITQIFWMHSLLWISIDYTNCYSLNYRGKHHHLNCMITAHHMLCVHHL